MKHLAVVLLLAACSMGQSVQTIAVPGSSYTQVNKINGGQACGWYGAEFTSHGFVFRNGHYTTIDFPGAVSTVINGCYKDTVVGLYQNPDYNTHGFLFSNGRFRSYDHPHAIFTILTDVTGTQISGTYANSTGVVRSFIIGR